MKSPSRCLIYRIWRVHPWITNMSFCFCIEISCKLRKYQSPLFSWVFYYRSHSVHYCLLVMKASIKIGHASSEVDILVIGPNHSGIVYPSLGFFPSSIFYSSIMVAVITWQKSLKCCILLKQSYISWNRHSMYLSMKKSGEVLSSWIKLYIKNIVLT